MLNHIVDFLRYLTFNRCSREILQDINPVVLLVGNPNKFHVKIGDNLPT